MTFAPAARMGAATSAEVSFGVARKTTSGFESASASREYAPAGGPVTPPSDGCRRENGTGPASRFPEEKTDATATRGCRARIAQSSPPE